MPIRPSGFVGIKEIAEMAQVNASAVADWRRRLPDFPKPVVDLPAGPVFRATDVQAWLAKRGGGTSPPARKTSKRRP